MNAMRFLAATLCAILLATGCNRTEPQKASFAGSLRCGMTREEVTALAHRLGYGDADAKWLTRESRQPSKNAKELELLDLTFHEGRLVAYRQGKYDPATRRTAYRTVTLCGGT